MPPTPPLTALELLDGFDRHSPSEIVAQLKVDLADDREQRAMDRCAVYRWKNAAREDWRP